jgi:hypothetical protein
MHTCFHKNVMVLCVGGLLVSQCSVFLVLVFVLVHGLPVFCSELWHHTRANGCKMSTQMDDNL